MNPAELTRLVASINSWVDRRLCADAYDDAGRHWEADLLRSCGYCVVAGHYVVCAKASFINAHDFQSYPSNSVRGVVVFNKGDIYSACPFRRRDSIAWNFARDLYCGLNWGESYAIFFMTPSQCSFFVPLIEKMT